MSEYLLHSSFHVTKWLFFLVPLFAKLLGAHSFSVICKVHYGWHLGSRVPNWHVSSLDLGAGAGSGSRRKWVGEPDYLDVTHKELYKWLNKNGAPKNFAKSGTDKLFLYDERKNNHFVKWKDKSNEYSEKSWALFDKSFWYIAIMWGNRLILINCN